jgi:hypothetical protein
VGDGLIERCGVMNATWISSLAATGPQEMRPAWSPAGMGGSMTGINRADSATV